MLFVGCGDGWDLEDLGCLRDAKMVIISDTHQHPNPVHILYQEQLDQIQLSSTHYPQTP
jgi:hypothetical protein